MSLFLSFFLQVVIGINIQQLCISKINKNVKLVEYYSIKDQLEKRIIQLHIQDMMNLKLVFY